MIDEVQDAVIPNGTPSFVTVNKEQLLISAVGQMNPIYSPISSYVRPILILRSLQVYIYAGIVKNTYATPI
jgi:hypothetical protein